MTKRELIAALAEAEDDANVFHSDPETGELDDVTVFIITSEDEAEHYDYPVGSVLLLPGVAGDFRVGMKVTLNPAYIVNLNRDGGLWSENLQRRILLPEEEAERQGRISLVQGPDRIYVLWNGDMTESGSYQRYQLRAVNV